MKPVVSFLLCCLSVNVMANDSLMLRKISDEIMLHGQAYNNLRVLCKSIGNRLSGSPQAAKAVLWGEKTLKEAGADKVWLQSVTVPKWVRDKEQLKVKYGGSNSFHQIPMLSLGNSIGTDGKLLEAPVLMVRSFDEYKSLTKADLKGKVLFFNFRFPQEEINTFEGYGIAGPYRWMGPNMAAAKEAAGVIIRSISTGLDDVPHTGSMRYADTVKPIPALAIGNFSADSMEQACMKGTVTIQLVSNCKMEGTAPSHNVIAEIKGSEFPDEIVLVSGHLDSWDVGEGAHDDGCGIVQSIEVIRTFKALGIKPKRTIRAVLFMNEENGVKGGAAYADSAKARGEKHIVAMESDAGGFSPRGFGTEMSAEQKEYIKTYAPLFLPYNIYDFEKEEGGVDIGPLHRAGTPAIGLLPDPQRYFDLHHTANDVFEAVNHRELKLGAVAMAQMVYLISEHGMK